MPARIDRSVIVNFYRGQTPARQERPPDFGDATFVNRQEGLGDTVLLTALPRAAHAQGRTISIFSFSRHFPTLVGLNSFYTPGTRSRWAPVDDLYRRFNLGSGHYIQQVQRACGLTPELLPRGCLTVERPPQVRGRTVLHFEPGVWVEKQRQTVHPRAREVYPEHMAALREFIRRSTTTSFVEVGSRYSKLDGVEDWTGLPLAETIRRMATCEYFIGINSGPMHLAAALGLKIIAIVNIPAPTQIYLPYLKLLHVRDIRWLYPQSVILHEDGDGPIVNKFSVTNLERAVAGELYPYWSDDYLDLVFERI